MNCKRGFVAILGICIFLFPFVSVHAQQVSLSLSPPILEAVIKPGKSILIAYTVENSGDPLVLKPQVVSFVPQGNNGEMQLKQELSGPVRFQLDNSQIALEEPFFLKSKDSQQLLLRIRIPEGTPEGDYYYSLLVQSEPPPTTEGIGSTRATVKIGSPILLTVTRTGMLDLKGKITTFDVIPRLSFSLFGTKIQIVDSNDTIPAILTIYNQGKNAIKPQGTLNLRGNFGEKISYDVEPVNILAESERLVTATPSADIDCDTIPKKGLCNNQYSLLLQGFFIGLYTLSTTINFGEGSPLITANTNFIALPLRLLVALIIVIGIALLLLVKLKDRKTKPKDQTDSVTEE
ncbi:hypothetical protein HGA88_00305 [Candidatus Roizmanbacteria bacterium]|nr:hypothetical protein [Candidatus Roizmanbacteria bacterium]